MIKYFNFQPYSILQRIPDDISVQNNRVHKFKFDLQIGEEIPKITNSLNRYGFVIYKKKKEVKLC